MSEKRCCEIFDEVYQNSGDLLLNDIKTKFNEWIGETSQQF